MSHFWKVSLKIEVGAILLVMATGANLFVDNFCCRSLAWSLPMHLGSCWVLKFNMAINAFNTTLLSLGHDASHSELQGVTSQATFVHAFLLFKGFYGVGVTR